MAERTVSDLLVERLSAWGVERVFGYSGDGIDGVMGALRRAGKPEFVQARHEENAAFMAVGHAKYTGASACACPRRALERCICSTGCTTPSWTPSRWWR